MICLICSKLPEASLTATTLAKSCARRRVVSAVMFTTQRPGMLYSTMGSSVARAMVAKCW